MKIVITIENGIVTDVQVPHPFGMTIVVVDYDTDGMLDEALTEVPLTESAYVYQIFPSELSAPAAQLVDRIAI